MINVGIDAHMLGDHSGGNESYYRNILSNMRIPDDMTIYLIVNSDAEVYDFEDRYKIVRFKTKNAFFRTFFELPKISRMYNIDVMHTQYFIPIHRNCKYVCTIHDICFEHFKNIFTKKQYYSQKILIPYAAKHSRKIFTVSEHAKSDIATCYGIRKNNILVTYNAVSSSFRVLNNEELDIEELKKEYGINTDIYILSVGNLQPRKNLVRLIKAFKNIRMKNSDVQLVIVGNPAWRYNDILAEAISDVEDDSIIFTGYVSDRNLIRLYNAATCFVYPSYYEGFGIPPIEAMACETPVALSNATSLPEVAGCAAIYFDPFKEEEIERAVDTLLEDGILRKTLVEKGKNQVNKFDWTKSANIILETYREVVEESSKDVYKEG